MSLALTSERTSENTGSLTRDQLTLIPRGKSKKLNRRKIGQLLIGTVAKTAIALAAADIAITALRYTPSRPPSGTAEGYLVHNKGWVGAGLTTFLDDRTGPEVFLRNAVMTNEVLKPIASGILAEDYSDMYRSRQRYNSLADLEEVGLKHTLEVFSSLKPEVIQPGLDIDREMYLASSVALALASSGWPSIKDHRLLEVKSDVIPDNTKSSDAFWKGESSIGRVIMPKVLPHPEKIDPPDVEPNFGGEDGVRHFMVAKAIYLLLKRSIEEGTQLDKSLPNGIKWAAANTIRATRLPDTPQVWAGQFTEWAGVFYEAKKTLEIESGLSKNIPWISGRSPDQINAGFFDEEVGKDLKVNKIAIVVGEMMDQAKTQAQRQRVISILRDPYLTEISATPVLQLLTR